MYESSNNCQTLIIINMKKRYYLLAIMFISLVACENEKWSFPNFDYTTVYFAYQTPVRTITLGTDYSFDNSLDNAHKCMIMATMGGVYNNDRDVIISVKVDNSLCNYLHFEIDTGAPVLPMPASYYKLPQNLQIVIPKGELMGGIEVELTDDFFNDTLALKNTYVIPLVMTSVTNADSILQGKPLSDTARKVVVNDWEVAPKDYVLYAIKYINPWHGFYLRRGVNEVKGNGNPALDTKYIYHKKYVEWDEECKAVSKSRNEVVLSLKTKADDKVTDIPFQVILTFDANNNCTVKNPQNASYTATGSGKYVLNGDEFGDKKRDVLYLQFSVNFGTSTHNFTDTLVLRNRGVQFETFNPVYVKN